MTHSALRERFAPGARRRPPAERLLAALAVDPALIEAVLGDLAEEYAARRARDGELAARWWRAREYALTVPPLAWGAFRRLSVEAQVRVVAWTSGGVLALGFVAFLLSLRAGPPARLVVAAHGQAGGVVVNNERRPVQLPLRVLDAAGRPLPTTGVRYEWVSGVPVTLSPQGALTCTDAGDAIVRASLGAIVTPMRVLCRPVSSVLTEGISLVVGGPSHELTFLARDSAGRRVTDLTGTVRSRDTSIVALEVKDGSYRVRARAAGSTRIDIVIGDAENTAGVTAYAPVATLEGLGPEQRHAAVAVRLAPGEWRRWLVSRGTYGIGILPDDANGPQPRLMVAGANCIPGAEGLTCASAMDFWVYASVPPDAGSATTHSGYVVLRRSD